MIDPLRENVREAEGEELADDLEARRRDDVARANGLLVVSASSHCVVTESLPSFCSVSVYFANVPS